LNSAVCNCIEAEKSRVSVRIEDIERVDEVSCLEDRGSKTSLNMPFNVTVNYTTKVKNSWIGTNNRDNLLSWMPGLSALNRKTT
jgi:hypothetical protein